MFAATALAGATLLSGFGEPPQGKLSPPPNTLGTKYGVSYGKPFIDVDEMRTSPRPHRYIHGGFENSHLRFSIYLPPKEIYKQRFLLELEGGQGGLDKMLAARSFAPGAVSNWDWLFNVAFDDLGAYLVETNEGHWPDEGLGVDNAKDIWQASNYGTDYARLIAKAVYGAAPTHGYVNGCSGGGLRTAAAIQHAPELFDGAVPQAWGSNQRTQWSIEGLAGTLLGDKLAELKDAGDVGGTDIYKGLTPAQADAVRMLLRLGYPREAFQQINPNFGPAAGFSIYNILDTDPSYFTDFWNKTGYLGADDPNSLRPLMIDTELEVENVLTGKEVGAAGNALFTRNTEVATYGTNESSILNSQPSAKLKYGGDLEKLFSAKVTILTGPDAGKFMYVMTVGKDGVITPFLARAPWGFDHVKAGDKVRIDNRDRIAYLYLYRYLGEALAKKLDIQQPGHTLLFPAHRWLEKPDGTPMYPQRSAPLGYHPTESLGDLNPKSKMIVLGGAADEPIWPVGMQTYEQMVRKKLGAKADDQFRLWWLDQTPHCSGPMTGPRSTSLVPNTGVTAEAVRQVVRWAEQGVPPSPSTGYRFSDENALLLPDTAAERRGVQPVVKLSANGVQRVEVNAGTPVTFVASGEVPPGAGSVANARFDFEGQGAWPESVKVSGNDAAVNATMTHVYQQPGTYFAAFRVGARPPNGRNPEPIYNLARVRVVVR